MNTYDCERFRDELADCLDETLSSAAAEHLAGCDACRDLRHDARLAVRAAARAGADYTPMDPDALAAKVLAAIDARAPAQDPPRIERTAPVVALPAPATLLAPASAPTTASTSARGATERVSAPRRPRGRITRAVGAFAALAAAAVAVFSLRPEAPRSTGTQTDARADVAWQGTVARVLRAGADHSVGIHLQRPGASAWEELAERAAIAPGSAIRTDPRTRARVELADGTVLVLDRDTELRLDPRVPRAASLSRGNLVADVAHAEVPARIKTASGEVEVLGTRFALAATDDHTTVRVTRGAVRLGDARGAVEVKAGQEGVADRGEAPRVAPAVDLAGAFAWSELGGGRAEAHDTAVVGLGELRAKRPGSTAERDRAVHLERHAVKVRIVGNVARTEVEQVFRNDSGDTLEGIYRFPLPPDAQVEDLALDVEGRMESGAFVERDRAAAIWRGAIRQATPAPRRVVEEFVWVPGPWRDPALLEWQRGGRFELRVYPIPARGSRRVRIAYTQTIPVSSGVRRYTYPLAHDPAGSTRVDLFDLDVQVLGSDTRRPIRATGYPLRASAGDDRRISFSQRDFVPAGDLTVEYATPNPGAMTAWAYDAADGGGEGGYVAIALRPQLPRWGEVRPRDYVLVVDASRSMTGERYARAARLVGGVIAEMDRRDRFTVLACDTRCRELPGGARAASGEGARDAIRFLEGVEPAGATDLAAQVRAALGARGVGDAGRDLRLVYVGDGVSTAGFRRPERVAAAVGATLSGRPATLTAVAVGVDADVPALQAIARVGGGAMVPYVPGESLAAASLAVLEATWGVALREPEVELPAGLTAVAPRALPTLRAGAEAVIVARMTAPQVSGEVVLRGTVAGERFTSRHALALTASRDAGNAFVPRLYAAARVADLDREEGEAAKREAVRLSQRFRVPSRHTSLLVLESAAMFRAFGLDRAHEAPQWTGEVDAVASETAGTLGNTVGEDAEASLDELASGGGEARGRGAGMRAPARASAERARSRDDLGDGDFASVQATPAPSMPAAMGGAVRAESAARPAVIARPFPRDPRGGRWMQRVWVRRGSVTVARGDGLSDAPSLVAAQLDRARRALAENPDSRDRHRELFRWLSVGGALDEAAQVAARWSARDPLDVDALARRADVLAREGRREDSVRALEGTADARPDDVPVLERLAQMHERGGDPRAACAWRVSLAEVRGRDAQHLARAVRCLRETGDAAMWATVLDGVELALREQVERLAAEPSSAGSVRGELQVSARWDGDADLDIALIDPRGVRVSWQGGRAGITAQDATRAGRESLGLSRASSGDWTVEVVRAVADPSEDEPVRGEVTVTVLGERRTVPFTLAGARARVARATVTRESQLVPVTGPVPPGSRIVW